MKNGELDADIKAIMESLGIPDSTPKAENNNQPDSNAKPPSKEELMSKFAIASIEAKRLVELLKSEEGLDYRADDIDILFKSIAKGIKVKFQMSEAIIDEALKLMNCMQRHSMKTAAEPCMLFVYHEVKRRNQANKTTKA